VKLMGRVRALPGFIDFLFPRKFAQLRSAAHAGPVVVVNVHKHRCNALVLMASLDDVMHIPLTRFSYGKAQKLHRLLNQTLVCSGTHALRNTRLIRDTDIAFRCILSNLRSCVVNPVLNGLAITVRFSNFLLSRLTYNVFVAITHRRSPSHLVVPDRFPYLSTNSRHGNI